MKRIPLTKGKYALVDDEDYAFLTHWKWRAGNSESGKIYASTLIDGHDIKMHRLLLNAYSLLVDHINGDTLDNRKTNLRKATKSQNAMNQKIRKDNTTGYKGVTRWKNKYRARLILNGKFISLGYFNTAEEASKAYNMAAQRLFKEFYRNS